MTLRDWVKLPTAWIREDGLTRLQWQAGKSDNIAALMLLMVIAHRVDPETGMAKLTYGDFTDATGLSRTKVSTGLQVLEKLDLIRRDARSTCTLLHHNETPWAKLPCKSLYRGKEVSAFGQMHLRSINELRAMKIYLFIVANRDNATNMAHLGYLRISQGTGVAEAFIRTALSFLTLHGLIHVENLPRLNGEDGYYRAYRVAHIDPFRHSGTSTAKDIAAAEARGAPRVDVPF